VFAKNYEDVDDIVRVLPPSLPNDVMAREERSSKRGPLIGPLLLLLLPPQCHSHTKYDIILKGL
jgi:hypothetical protein